MHIESWKIWLIAGGVSLVFHLVGVKSLRVKAAMDDTVRDVKVKIQIVEAKPEPVAPPPPPPPPPAPKPSPKPKEKIQPKKVATIRKPPESQKPQQEPVKPLQGLSESSFAKDGKQGISAPRGNTLMTEDTGERAEEQPQALNVDLSADAVLISSSILVPEYTNAALDANLEGYITVDVFVDKTGLVVEAELRKKVGYGMDQRILDAAYEAKFEPRKNRNGGAEDSWTEIRFNLRIP